MELVSKPLIIVKLGGAFITDDSQFQRFQKELAERLLKTLGELIKDFKFIIIHGAGSFGHYHAKEYAFTDGFVRQAQLEGVVKTHESMLHLNTMLLASAKMIKGFLPISFPPMGMCTTSAGRISNFNLKPLQLALAKGFTPVLFGDVVMDHQMGFTILSGDQITPYLAVKLNAQQIVMLTDVEGVFDDNSSINLDARLLAELDLSNTELLQSISDRALTEKTRVTGVMEKKLLELQPAVKEGITSWEIMNFSLCTII